MHRILFLHQDVWLNNLTVVQCFQSSSIVVFVALACLLVMADSVTRMVRSMAHAYYKILPTTACIRVISSLVASGESSVSIGSWATVPYFFGANGYGECCGLVRLSCLYFCGTFMIHFGMDKSNVRFP